jgi:lipopolysaccharide biosynthesis regulator YciM
MSASERYLKWAHGGGIAGFMCAGAATIWGIIFLGLSGGNWALLPLMALAGWVIGAAIGGFWVRASGTVALETLQPSAPGTYAQGYSAIQALEAQERFAEAIDAWESVAVAQPMNPWPLIRAGELYRTRLGDAQRARARFVNARDLPSITAELRLYAMQKLIDLYLGPLDDQGRALVELRRLVEEYPGTTDAEAARRAIAAIKDERHGPERTT